MHSRNRTYVELVRLEPTVAVQKRLLNQEIMRHYQWPGVVKHSA